MLGKSMMILQKLYDFAEGYRQFISQNKTERECAAFFERKAKAAGFKDLNEVIKAAVPIRLEINCMR